jgi:penicillin-binding protein-related factor A (putative recombinase)
MSTPEGKVKIKVRAELIKRDVYHFMPATGGFGRNGIPDIVGCYRGYFFAIETKSGSKKPTALQEKELQHIRDSGGVAFVINETNVIDIVEWLDGV